MTPRRAAIGSAGLVALAVLLLSVAEPLPPRVIAWFGGPSTELAREGGMRLTWQPPPNFDRAHFERINPAIPRTDRGYVLPVPRVAREDVAQTAQRIAGAGRLEFHEVLETPEMRELYRRLAAPRNQHPLVGVEIDHWREEEAGKSHDDYYLYGPTIGEIEARLADPLVQGWALPAGMHLAYEHVSPFPGAKDRSDHWRTYVVADEAALDGADVDHATGSMDPYSNRPTVMLDLTREGGRRFGDLTARIVGHKLAIMLDGQVRSAPVIMTPIRGGRASISLGAGSVEEQEREQHALVTTLSGTALPAGGTIVEAVYVPPEVASAIAPWLARAVVMLLGGLVAGAFAWLVVRKGAPRSEQPTVLAGTGTPRIAGRLAWTALGLLLLFIGSQLVLPGVNEAEFTHIVTRGGGSSWWDATQVSIFALGIMPLITSFIVIEIVCSLVPGWRRLRDRPEGRRKIGRAVAIAALLVSAVQAWFVATYFEALSRGGADLVVPGLHSRLLIVATLTAGTATIAWIVSLISHRGLGNGYAVAIAAGWLFHLPWTHTDQIPLGAWVLGAVTIAIVAAILLTIMRWRVGEAGQVGLPLPISGTSPLAQAGGIGTGILTISALGLVALQERAASFLDTTSHLAPAAVLLLVGTAVWGYAFAHPGRRAAELARAGLTPATRASWLRATALTGIALLLIYVITHAAAYAEPFLAKALEPISLCTVIAIGADLLHEGRARGRELIPVWPLHDPLLVDAARAQLTAAGIPHYLQSVRLRTLLWVFGSYVPIQVFVPPDRAEDADRVLRALLGP